MQAQRHDGTVHALLKLGHRSLDRELLPVHNHPLRRHPRLPRVPMQEQSIPQSHMKRMPMKPRHRISQDLQPVHQHWHVIMVPEHVVNLSTRRRGHQI
jgi:hypothetical protein